MAKRLFSPLKRKEVWNYEDFSVKLLEKELEFEKTYSIEIIQDLITLYSEAIEHYNEESDPKFYDFQDRMHSFLMKPEVMEVTNGNPVHNLYNFTKRKNFCSHELIKSKILEHEPGPKLSKIKSEEFPIGLKKEEIADSVSKQELNLKERVNQGRERKGNGYNELANISTKGSYYLDEKDQLEMIMEKYYARKAKEISDVTLFYLMKMESADEQCKQSLAEELKREVLSISSKHDQIRINALKKLKKSVNKP